ncbi:hypothetical protein SKAU_G00135740 [Synaphobranchus kaupii]|uniref:Uncharacterized protein n=1 Tax=Synaphobranchus kaupii TaxID=118154 RepID=A0A9Q1J3S4_SYNKA|nr:hypothetical protein SKAU_G00135740 [Synaphobranchus kaupii]
MAGERYNACPEPTPICRARNTRMTECHAVLPALMNPLIQACDRHRDRRAGPRGKQQHGVLHSLSVPQLSSERNDEETLFQLFNTKHILKRQGHRLRRQRCSRNESSSSAKGPWDGENSHRVRRKCFSGHSQATQSGCDGAAGGDLGPLSPSSVIEEPGALWCAPCTKSPHKKSGWAGDPMMAMIERGTKVSGRVPVGGVAWAGKASGGFSQPGEACGVTGRHPAVTDGRRSSERTRRHAAEDNGRGESGHDH